MPNDFGIDPADGAEQVIRTATDAEVNPDEEGPLIDLSAKSGVPTDVLRAQSSPQRAMLDTLPTRADVFKRNHDIAQWIIDNPQYGSVAGQEAQQLEEIKKAMPDWLRRDNAQKVDTLWDRVAATAEGPIAGVVSGVGAIGKSLYGTRASADAFFGNPEAEAQDLEQAEKAGNLGVYLARAVHGGDFAEAEKLVAERQRLTYAKIRVGDIEINEEDVVSSAVSLLPTALVASLGWPAILAAAAQQTQGSAYADFRARGDSQDKALGLSVAEGAITAALTRAIPGIEGSLQRMLSGSVSRTVAARAVFAKVVGKQVASEFAEEGLDQFAQTIISEASDTKNPQEWGAILSHAASQGLKAGLLGGFVGGLFGAGEARHMSRIQGALNFHESNTKLASALDNSAIGQRSTVASREFLQSQGMRQDSMVYVSGEDAKTVLGGDANTAQQLSELGVTQETVEAARSRGGSLAIRASDLMTSDPGIRDRILELARQSPKAMSKVEADAAQKELEAHKDEVKDLETKQSKFVKDLAREEARATMRAAAAAGMDTKTARTLLTGSLFAFARSLYLRNPAAARAPIELLKSFQPIKRGLSRAEILQTITDLVGEDGKDALARVSVTDLGAATAGRSDVLTGQFEVNDKALPDSVSLGEMLLHRQEKTKSFEETLAGRTVSVADKSGKRSVVDAEAAVATIRQRAEAARRLAACL
jgi:hypothetical protein